MSAAAYDIQGERADEVIAYLEDCATRGLSTEEVKAEMQTMLELLGMETAPQPPRRRKAKVVNMAAWKAKRGRV